MVVKSLDDDDLSDEKLNGIQKVSYLLGVKCFAIGVVLWSPLESPETRIPPPVVVAIRNYSLRITPLSFVLRSIIREKHSAFGSIEATTGKTHPTLLSGQLYQEKSWRIFIFHTPQGI